MKELLPGQEVADGRYVIVKTITFGERGGVYVARRTSDDTRWALKEIIPSRTLNDEQVKHRAEQLMQAMEVLSSFDHPGLSKLVDHFVEGRRQYVVLELVDGVTMKALLDMSVKGQPEKQVLEWAMALCDALHYLHNRPRPFVFDALDPSNIMVTAEGKLKLINFGLDRFFDEEDVPEFSSSAEILTADLRKFGETIFFFLTRREPGPFGCSQSDPISIEAAKVINRLLSAEEKGIYVSFEEIKKGFDKVLHPPVQQQVQVSKISFAFARWARWSLSYTRLWQEFLWRFFQQPIWLVAVEALSLVVGLWLLNRYMNPPLYPREEPAAYVACRDRLYVVSKKDHKVLSIVTLTREAASLGASPDGKRLYIATDGFLQVMNTHSNRVITEVPIDKRPGAVLVDPNGKFVYVLHPETGQVSVVEMDAAPLPEIKEGPLKRKDSLVGLLPVGRNSLGLALDTTEQPPVAVPVPGPPGTEPEQVVPRKLYVSTLDGGLVYVYQPFPAKLLNRIPIPNPGALALAGEKADQLFVALPKEDHIRVVSCPRCVMGRLYSDVGGKGPMQFLLPASGQEVWVLNQSGTLGVLSPTGTELRQTVQVGGPATSGCLVAGADRDEIWVTTRQGQVVIVSATGRAVSWRVSVGSNPTSIVMVQ